MKVDSSDDALADGRAPARGKARRRWRPWLIALAVPVTLIAADALYWHIAERNLEQGFAAWLAARRADGWVATTQPGVPGGWPLAATLTIPGVSLSGATGEIPGGFAWRAEKLTLRYVLWRPREVTIATAGAQRLRFADGPPISYTVNDLRLEVPVQADAPQFAELSAEAIHADLPGGSNVSLGGLQLHLDLLPDASAGRPTLRFAFRAKTISPPAPFNQVLGPRITNLTADGALDGPVGQVGTPEVRAAAWRDAGGSLAIQRLALIWGPLDLTGSATLALDRQLQPMGAGSVRAIGYANALDALATHGFITRSTATAAKAILSLLAHNPDDGGPPDVEVPLTLQYRTLSMRQVPLMRLPELDWH
jgi:hypothetical protein